MSDFRVRLSIAQIFIIFTPWEGDFGVRIKFNKKKKNRGSFGAWEFLTRMLSLILRRIFFEFGPRIFFFVKLLKPLIFAVIGALKIIENIEINMRMLRPLCPR
jgi:hypothetical protein